LLAGGGEESYLNKLKALPGWEYVDYYGKIPYEEVLDLYNNSLIGMDLIAYSPNTSWRLGTMGNTKLFEMMMAGLAVICTDFVLWRAIIEEYKCGLYVNPGDAVAVEKAISYLVANPEETVKMGERARLAVEEKYNWSIESKKLLKLYDDILGD
jgi:glycosyltransferase involved in cell wall biosynthesis